MSAHLVAVDLQRLFADPASDWAAPRFAGVVAPVRALALALAPAVTFTRFVAPARPEGAWVDYYARWPFALQPPGAPDYAVADELADLAAAAGPTVDATTFGKWGPALAARAGEADRLVVAGVATDCCVLSTVLAAADAGQRVQVVADACAGSSDAAHAQALAVLARYSPLVEVLDAAAVLDELGAA